MENWKKRLYDGYISSGQAGQHINRQSGLHAKNYPHLIHIIQKHLPKDRSISTLDLACGHGSLVFCLKSQGYHNTAGIDISPEQVQLAHELGVGDVQCVSMDAYLSDKKQKFDAIFMMDILEHLSKSELMNCLEQVDASLAEHGMLILHIPNAEGIFGMRIRYGDLTHENCFTPQSIRQALSIFGMSQVECFEDKPLVHGLKSLIRRIIWTIGTFPFRLLLSAETGTTRHILSQNMLVVARKQT